MSIYKTTLVMVQAMRKLGITAPMQQLMVLMVLDNPGISPTLICERLRENKDAVNPVVARLKYLGIILCDRPKHGQIRTSSLHLREDIRLALTMKGGSDE